MSAEESGEDHRLDESLIKSLTGENAVRTRFLYQEEFDYEFHRACILELARITRREIRIYPLTDIRAIRSSYVEQLMRDPACSNLTFELVRSDFEFIKNLNQLLVIKPKTVQLNA